jgi:hypothetical protein
MQTLTGIALLLALTPFDVRADDERPDPPDLAIAIPNVHVPETLLRDAEEAAKAPMRSIGELEWHTSYTAAFKQAREEKKQLFLLFRDEQSSENSRIVDIYENEVLASPDLVEPLSEVVRVVLPLDAKRPFRIPELLDLTLMSHASFKYMYDRQGIAVIDLTDPESELHGHVVSAHPFTPGKHYTVRSTKIVLGLPTGTVTQRALIYAVRLHPAAPISTTDGKCHGYLCTQARNSSKLMATYESVGHHDWWVRYGEIATNTGKSAQEVAAMGGNVHLIDAAVFVVDQWYGSPAHWGIMSAPASIFGYDLVRAPSGNWYGTGIFAY